MWNGNQVVHAPVTPQARRAQVARIMQQKRPMVANPRIIHDDHDSVPGPMTIRPNRPAADQRPLRPAATALRSSSAWSSTSQSATIRRLASPMRASASSD
jgi:hypothetical protein